ncbi:MAG: hypothetical protein ACU84H_05100 [Gammaproteobacteria bacterium]
MIRKKFRLFKEQPPKRRHQGWLNGGSAGTGGEGLTRQGMAYFSAFSI